MIVPKNPSVQVLGARVPSELARRFRAAADRRGISVSELLRASLTAELDREDREQGQGADGR